MSCCLYGYFILTTCVQNDAILVSSITSHCLHNFETFFTPGSSLNLCGFNRKIRIKYAYILEPTFTAIFIFDANTLLHHF